MQLVLQHCCKTSFKATLRVACVTEKRATKNMQLVAAKRVEKRCCTFYHHFQTCQQPNLVQDIFNEGGKTRNVPCLAWRFCRARCMSGEAARKIQSPRGFSALARLHTYLAMCINYIFFYFFL